VLALPAQAGKHMGSGEAAEHATMFVLLVDRRRA
jgi:hypothetical protein